MMELFTSGPLLMTRELSIIFVFLMGHLSSKSRVFIDAMTLLLFTMIYNHWLKEIWRIPLAPHLLKEGWAFPSGHMHISLVFYGYIGWQLKKTNRWLTLTCLSLLIGIGLSLIRQGYHSHLDIWGAFFFGLLTLIFSIWLNSREIFLHRAWLLSLFILSLTILIDRLLLTKTSDSATLFYIHGSLLGIFLSSLLLHFFPTLINSKNHLSIIKRAFIAIVTLIFSHIIFIRWRAFSFLPSPLLYSTLAIWFILFPSLCTLFKNRDTQKKPN